VRQYTEMFAKIFQNNFVTCKHCIRSCQLDFVFLLNLNEPRSSKRKQTYNITCRAAAKEHDGLQYHNNDHYQPKTTCIVTASAFVLHTTNYTDMIYVRYMSACRGKTKMSKPRAKQLA